MLFEIEQVDVATTVLPTDVRWMAGFFDVIKITKKVDSDIQAFFELGNII